MCKPCQMLLHLIHHLVLTCDEASCFAIYDSPSFRPSDEVDRVSQVAPRMEEEPLESSVTAIGRLVVVLVL